MQTHAQPGAVRGATHPPSLIPARGDLGIGSGVSAVLAPLGLARVALALGFVLTSGAVAASAHAQETPPPPAPEQTPEPTEAAPAVPDEPPLVLRAKRVLVAPGEVLENGVVVVRNGRIVAVGTDPEVPEDARVIEGEVVCAAYIDAWSALGVERRSLADGRTDGATRAVDALDPWCVSHERDEAVAAGVLLVRAQTGENAEFGGIGAVVRNGAEGDDLVLLSDANLAAAVGISDRGRPKDPFDRVSEADRLATKLSGGRDYRADWVDYEQQLVEYEKKIAEKEKELEKDFKKAQKARDKDIEDAKKKGDEHKDKEYKEDKRPKTPKFDPEKETLARVVGGELPLFVRCDGVAELRALLTGTAEFPRLRLVIVGGAGAEAVAPDLVKRRIPVLVQPLPYSDLDSSRPEGQDLGLAGRLAVQGVDVLLGSGSSASRDLPLLAALAVGHGFDREAAFHALTLGPARALDVADQVGTVKVGKRAELLVLDGEPFSSGARVRAAISASRVVHEAPAR
jgi:imidazolonepropionase-like amidohydrolase